MIEETPEQKKEAEQRAWEARAIFHQNRAFELWRRCRSNTARESLEDSIVRYTRESEMAIMAHIAASLCGTREDIKEAVAAAYWETVLVAAKYDHGETL